MLIQINVQYVLLIYFDFIFNLIYFLLKKKLSTSYNGISIVKYSCVDELMCFKSTSEFDIDGIKLNGIISCCSVDNCNVPKILKTSEATSENSDINGSSKNYQISSYFFIMSFLICYSFQGLF